MFNKTDDCEVIETRDREPPQFESVRAGEDMVSREEEDIAGGESRDRGLTAGSLTSSETETSCPTTFDDEGRGASIPDSMERKRERLVERRREDAGASLSTTIHRGLTEFQVGDLLGYAFFVAS